MTIKEMETRSGLTRANIRFYEAEGLLTPHLLPAVIFLVAGTTRRRTWRNCSASSSCGPST